MRLENQQNVQLREIAALRLSMDLCLLLLPCHTVYSPLLLFLPQIKHYIACFPLNL